ncbi:DNA polymerase ligase N-terminal domain-containing protein [Prauserella muralis]|uniref:DNA ligase D 3'-phosphoesterase domain-containing protein n=1 Tax=Prauserella muralis TaxID=588067 RepID=A0A2V4B950_9PSEU|nr:DNA polymerase ligase N-terminal domain-containing protein [Prauserella muralis]PXY31894.1 hypothetical protein BAY60_06075 [Prauserella muralis]TWE13688.1 DNA polymerase ligase (LigD)-like protein [Prauserella muralis]
MTRRETLCAYPGSGEPGAGGLAQQAGRFVVERPSPESPHVVLRLRIGGAPVVAWALPRPPSAEPGERLLALRGDDDPPEGGDQALVWDAGEVGNLGDEPLERALAGGRLTIRLDGTRLRGSFTLVRTRIGEHDEQWLLGATGVSEPTDEAAP